MAHAYLLSYFPPIPVIDISISAPNSNSWQGPYTAIVDSGADFSIVPQTELESLGLPVYRTATLSSQWHDKRAVNIYEISLQLGNLTLLYAEVAGDPLITEWVLGRNVLNELDLRLDGPSLKLHLAGSE